MLPYNFKRKLVIILRRAGPRAVDLGEPSVYQGGGQSLKFSTKTAVFKIVSLLIGGPGPPGPPLAPTLILRLT